MGYRGSLVPLSHTHPSLSLSHTLSHTPSLSHTHTHTQSSPSLSLSLSDLRTHTAGSLSHSNLTPPLQTPLWNTKAAKGRTSTVPPWGFQAGICPAPPLSPRAICVTLLATKPATHWHRLLGPRFPHSWPPLKTPKMGPVWLGRSIMCSISNLSSVDVMINDGVVQVL